MQSLRGRGRARPSTDVDEAPEYWVAYSDLLVSLLVVFVLLLFLALASMQGERAKNEATRERVRQTLETSERAVQAAASAMGESSASYNPRDRTLTVQEQVLFEFGSAVLRPEAARVTAAVSDHFIPRLLADSVLNSSLEAIVIEGHTDTVGTFLSNLSLSQRRAESVSRAIVEATYGRPYGDRLRELLVASGRSEIEALKAGDAYDAASARRIVIRVRLREDQLLQELLRSEDQLLQELLGSGDTVRVLQ